MTTRYIREDLIRPNPYDRYPYFAGFYLGRKDQKSHWPGNWECIYLAPDKDCAQLWILERMVFHINGLMDDWAVDQYQPHLGAWIEAVEAWNFDQAMRMARLASESAHDPVAFVAGSTVPCMYDERSVTDDLIFSEHRDLEWSTGDMHGSTPWDVDYQDLWGGQRRHRLVPLQDMELVISNDVKRLLDRSK